MFDCIILKEIINVGHFLDSRDNLKIKGTFVIHDV